MSVNPTETNQETSSEEINELDQSSSTTAEASDITNAEQWELVNV